MIEDAETLWKSNGGVIATKGPVGNGVKCAARDPSNVIRAAEGANSIHDLSRRAPREGEQQDSLWRDPSLEQYLHASREGRCLSGTGAGNDAKRAISKRRCVELFFIEGTLRGEHVFDSTDRL